MSTTVTMPQLGETVTEGTILRWLKQPGDAVGEDELLLEISTDKVDTEVPSPAAGTLIEVLVPEGATVDVGTALAVIGEAGETSAPATPEPAEAPMTPMIAETAAEPAAPPAAEPEPGPVAPAAAAPPKRAGLGKSLGTVLADEHNGTSPTVVGTEAQVLSPVVRRLAAENDVDLGAVTGSGRGGRITRKDVEASIAGGGLAPAASTDAPAVLEPAAVEPAAVAPEPEPASVETAVPVAEPAPEAGGDQVIELDRMRVRIAQNMSRARQTAAHVFTSVEVDYESVERLRQAHRADFKQREGFSLTYLPFIARATIDALAAYPVVNSTFFLEEGHRIQHSGVDLGIGVDLDQGGLVVMTMRGADGLRMRGIAREVRRIADKARTGNMEPDDLAGSTFTITNPGPYGSFMSAPIINVPNVGILSTETVVKRPVVISDDKGHDAIAIHHMGILGLSWDHRAFDGSTAVLFLRRIKQNLETWDWEQELA